MSDSIRTYKAIRDALKHLYPQKPRGNTARRLNVLTALISGIVGSKKVNLPQIGQKVPDENKPESHIKQFHRWLTNEGIDAKLYLLPFISTLLATLAQTTLFLMMDGSVVGRGCITLMASVVYKGRALPIAWIVVRGKKGHLKEEIHLKLIEQLHHIIPEGARIVLLGDGKFDGTKLLDKTDRYGWKYVCRTGKSNVLFKGEKKFSFKDVFLAQGQPPMSLPDVLFTHEAYGPVHAILWWDKKYKEPFISLPMYNRRKRPAIGTRKDFGSRPFSLMKRAEDFI